MHESLGAIRSPLSMNRSKTLLLRLLLAEGESKLSNPFIINQKPQTHGSRNARGATNRRRVTDRISKRASEQRRLLFSRIARVSPRHTLCAIAGIRHTHARYLLSGSFATTATAVEKTPPLKKSLPPDQSSTNLRRLKVAGCFPLCALITRRDTHLILSPARITHSTVTRCE